MSEWKLKNKFEFNGRKVKWDVQGSGFPIILVHGTPWSSFNLRHIVHGLSNDFKVYYYDLLGYGQSDKSDQDVSLGIQNKVLAALIDHWKLDKPIAIGHDFGGTTVLRTHLINKKAYQKLILIDPVAISPWGSSFFQHVRKHENAFSGMPDYIHEAIVETYIKTAAHRELPPETIRGIIEPWLGALGKAAFYRQIAQADSRYTDEIQEAYRTIEVPTLILWGKEDPWIPATMGAKLNGLIPKSRLKTIADSGHLVIEEQYGPLIEEIKHFIRE